MKWVGVANDAIHVKENCIDHIAIEIMKCKYDILKMDIERVVIKKGGKLF